MEGGQDNHSQTLDPTVIDVGVGKILFSSQERLANELSRCGCEKAGRFESSKGCILIIWSYIAVCKE